MSVSPFLSRARRFLRTLTPKEAGGIALLEIGCTNGGPITSSVLVPGCIDAKDSGAMEAAAELLREVLQREKPLESLKNVHVLEDHNFAEIRRHLLES